MTASYLVVVFFVSKKGFLMGKAPHKKDLLKAASMEKMESFMRRLLGTITIEKLSQFLFCF